MAQNMLSTLAFQHERRTGVTRHRAPLSRVSMWGRVKDVSKRKMDGGMGMLLMFKRETRGVWKPFFGLLTHRGHSGDSGGGEEGGSVVIRVASSSNVGEGEWRDMDVLNVIKQTFFLNERNGPSLPLSLSISNPGSLVIVTGNPGVFQGYPYPTQQKPIPSPQVQVFSRLG